MGITITADRARTLSRLPNELKELSELIRSEAVDGKDGVWIEVSDPARLKLKEAGYELTKDRPGHPGQTWIYWGH